MEKSRALTLRSLKISKEKFGGVHMHATTVSLPIEWPFEAIEGAFRAGAVPTNTVRTRMFNARKRMSKLLQEVGVDRTYQ
jgi:hypothetical protein